MKKGTNQVPLKILHTADLHLGMTFKNRSYPETVREQLIEARFDTLARIVGLANTEQCALLVIAGDLFHRPNIAATTITRTINILERFQGCTALLPGNHDYYDHDGPLWRALRSEAFDELILLTEEHAYPLQDYGLDAVLYPAPCDKKHSSTNRLGWIDPPSERPSACHHIGIAHGSVQGISPDLEDQYFPMTTAELSALKMQHWCLGHTHVRHPDCNETGQQPFLISGVPEPDGFDCRHSGYVWLTELTDKKNSSSCAVETGRLRFREIEKKVYSVADLDSLQQELAPEGERTLIKLKLCGALSDTDFRARGARLNTLRDQLLYLETDDSELTVEITPELIAARYPESSFPHHLLTRLAKRGDPEALHLAYRLADEVKK